MFDVLLLSHILLRTYFVGLPHSKFSYPDRLLWEKKSKQYIDIIVHFDFNKPTILLPLDFVRLPLLSP